MKLVTTMLLVLLAMTMQCVQAKPPKSKGWKATQKKKAFLKPKKTTSKYKKWEDEKRTRVEQSCKQNPPKTPGATLMPGKAINGFETIKKTCDWMEEKGQYDILVNSMPDGQTGGMGKQVLQKRWGSVFGTVHLNTKHARPTMFLHESQFRFKHLIGTQKTDVLERKCITEVGTNAELFTQEPFRPCTQKSKNFCMMRYSRSRVKFVRNHAAAHVVLERWQGNIGEGRTFLKDNLQGRHEDWLNIGHWLIPTSIPSNSNAGHEWKKMPSGGWYNPNPWESLRVGVTGIQLKWN